jgi:hypothetical protein
MRLDPCKSNFGRKEVCLLNVIEEEIKEFALVFRMFEMKLKKSKQKVGIKNMGLKAIKRERGSIKRKLSEE